VEGAAVDVRWVGGESGDFSGEEDGGGIEVLPQAVAHQSLVFFI